MFFIKYEAEKFFFSFQKIIFMLQMLFYGAKKLFFKHQKYETEIRTFMFEVL